MTAKELVYRAATLWGMQRIVRTEPMTNGSLDVILLRLGRAGSDTRDRAGSHHRLNADGAPVCHKDCQDMALELDTEERS